MSGNPALAAQIAVTALKRGAQARTAVLAHARHLSLGEAARTSGAADEPASSELRDLARQMASTRPAIERSVVDLELRYGLDQVTFGRVLGLSAQKAALRSRTVAQVWAANLDPAMMAALGPGACDQLRALLDERGSVPILTQDHTPPHGTPVVAATGTDGVAMEPAPAATTVKSVLDAAPEVLAHAKTCDICEVRLKRMTSVRTLVGQQAPEPVPPLVATAARSARRRLPAPLPPSIEPRSFDIYRFKNLAIALAAIAAAGLVILGGYGAVAGGEASQEERVERLINEAPLSSLLGTPSVIGPDTTTASLANTSDAVVAWNATPNAAWLDVEPRSGTIQPSQSATLRLSVDVPSAGVPDDEASITIVGDDGSRQILKFRNDG